MPLMLRRAGLVAVAALSHGPTWLMAQADPAVTVFIVRHAEKGSNGTDPSLTDQGVARAAELGRLLRDAGIATIYVSQFKRTQETAVPLAKEIHQNPVIADAGRPDDLVASIKALPPGSRALVVTHSNLVPGIVEKLTGQKMGELTDSDYDRLYVVSLTSGGGSVLYLHYGAPSPSGAGGAMRP